ncbi:hypothetical protein I316_03833 [Kwoniella heveanensis BCC8398]|uniref:Kri1-like C-terminal domain-containing protein n=1 Tax=Kwoniella heveanensis BCC8398 TaxID=1296120 RepID=A0A1B9GTC6_9TREE|nr:hypothetical protein I316_03833 [Kwoniella heveanensis BCC8398]
MKAWSANAREVKPRDAELEFEESASGSESDYSSSDVTEDEDGDELTPALDAAILRTLSKIKKKDGVYGSENVLQEELKRAQEKAEAKGIRASVVKKIAEKPYLLADYHRAKLLSGEHANEDDDENDRPEEPLTHVQSERLLRQEAVSAFKALGDDEDDDDAGEFIQKRHKEDEDVEQDDIEYRQFLLEMGGGEAEVRKVLGMGDQPVSGVIVDDEEGDDEERYDEAKQRALSKVEKAELKAKKEKKKAKKAKADEDFLMDYILNRGWIDRSEKHVPTYKEIVGNDVDSDASSDDDNEKDGRGKGESSNHPWGKLDEEEDFDEKADRFEAEYNFRFEEPGSSSIVSHPREIPSLVRRPDDARKTKRARRAERKAAERAAQEEEVRAKKGSKRREMEKRMASLKADLAEEGVEGGVDWDQLEKVLDGEWDEGEWEKVVGGMLSRANGGDDGAEEEGDEKPTWDDDIGDAEYDDIEMDEEGGADGDGGHDAQWNGEDDEGPINMDADFIDEEPSKKKRKKNKKDKKKNKLEAELESQAQAQLASEESAGLTVADKAKAVKEAMEEYRALDHEDMIGDLPTRFKYTQTAPTAYGLSPVEILLATDEELNKIFSVKTIAPYRKGGIGMQGKGLGKRVRELKEDLKKRRWGQEVHQSNGNNNAYAGAQKRKHGEQEGGESHGEGRKGKRAGKKERQRLKAQAEANGSEGSGHKQENA